MPSVKDTIAKNLAQLRKGARLTQQQLAEKLNYSDKAISRWERGETLPDIETLCRVCELYGVRFEYLLQEEQPPRDQNPYVKNKRNRASHVFIALILAATVWLCATVAYLWADMVLDKSLWNLFIWALPLTFLSQAICNRLFWRSRIFGAINTSFITWTTLLSLYLEVLRAGDNVWFFFLVGVPVQVIIIFAYILMGRSDER